MKKPIAIATNYEEDASDSLSTTAPHSSQAYMDENTSPDSFDSESLLDESKKIRKKREVYCKISDDIRIQLLEAVQNGETLKAAAKRFQVNYSSAKSILHTYRKEGRILKKSAQERNFKKKPEETKETKKTSKSTKSAKKNRAQSEEFDQEFTSYDENIMAQLSQEEDFKENSSEEPKNSTKQTQQSSQIENPGNFLVEENSHSNFAYLFNYAEIAPENSFKPQEDNTFPNYAKENESFIEMPPTFQSEVTFFDPNIFLCFKETTTHEERTYEEEDWESPLNCSLKSFLGSQNLFKDTLRRNSFCHDDNDSGFRKGSIDLF